MRREAMIPSVKLWRAVTTTGEVLEVLAPTRVLAGLVLAEAGVRGPVLRGRPTVVRGRVKPLGEPIGPQVWHAGYR